MMINKKNLIKQLIAIVFIGSFFLLGIIPSALAESSLYSATNYFGLVPLAELVYGGEKFPQSTVASIVGSVVGSVLSFLAIVFFILLVYGGAIWMMARGNQDDVDKAKSIIKDSTIGLIIILSAWTLTWFATKMAFTAVDMNF